MPALIGTFEQSLSHCHFWTITLGLSLCDFRTISFRLSRSTCHFQTITFGLSLWIITFGQSLSASHFQTVSFRQSPFELSVLDYSFQTVTFNISLSNCPIWTVLFGMSLSDCHQSSAKNKPGTVPCKIVMRLNCRPQKWVKKILTTLYSHFFGWFKFLFWDILAFVSYFFEELWVIF